MVATLEAVLEMKREKQQFEEMSDWEMKYLPRGLRLDFPLKSTQHWKRIAPLLREFAEAVDTELRRKDQTPVQVMEHIWRLGHILRMRVDQVCGVTRKTRMRNNDA